MSPGQTLSGSSTADTTRLRSLDGLRGLAACGVVLWHLFLVAQPHIPGALTREFTGTPLQILLLGPEAVVVFFLLSGMVIALPPLAARRNYRWGAYYPSRLVRLYVPVLAAVAAAAIVIIAVPRHGNPGGWLAATNATAVTPRAFLSEALLVTSSPTLDNPLWSLTWEVAFSLLLPVYVVAAIALRRAWPIGLAAIWCLMAAGAALGLPALAYLPIFFIGTLGATKLQSIQRAAKQLTSRRDGRWLWFAIGLASPSAMIFPYALGMPIGYLPWAAIPATIGGAGLMFCAIGSPAWRRFLESRAAQMLGRVSFSLYVVHVPVVATFAYQLPWYVAIPASAVAIPIATGLFFRAVERPSHHLSKRIGRRITSNA